MERIRLSNRWFAAMMVLLPTAMVLKDFSPRHGFLALPRFGGIFRPGALAEVRRFAPPVRPDSAGYDGQFYAQIAIDPSLRHPQLAAACDTLAYRAKRIGLPAMAYGLGLGQAWWVLQIYSILNVFFWGWLAWLLVRRFGCESTESRLLLIGILWSAGTLISISRALTDLPALCLSVWAVIRMYPGDDRKSSAIGSLGLMASAALVKETALLSVFGLWRAGSRREFFKSAILIPAVGLPVVCWFAYVQSVVGPDTVGIGNFSYPFFGFFEKLRVEWSEAIFDFPRFPILEMLAPLSMAIQAIWLVRSFEWRSEWWRWGAPYVVLTFMIGDYVWASQSAYSRCLLPMTVCFNILLFQDGLSKSANRKWWLLGNVGLLDRAAIGLAVMALMSWSMRLTRRRKSRKRMV